MGRSSSVAAWAGSLTTVVVAALGGPLPAVVTAGLSEGATHLLKAYLADAPTRDLHAQVQATVVMWAAGETLPNTLKDDALRAATYAVAKFGISDADMVRLDYDPVRAARVVVAKTKAAERFWTEPHHEVAERAIEVTYTAMFARLRGNEPTLLPAIRVLRASLIEQVAELREQADALRGHVDSRFDTLEVRVPPRMTDAYAATLRSFGRASLARMPDGLQGRDQELADIVDFATGPLGYRWLVGGAFTGKTALMYQAVTSAVPDTVDVVCYFLRRVVSDADSGRFLAGVIPQLAELCQVGPPGIDEHSFRSLWELAASRALHTGRHLLLVVDGLDEDLHPRGMPSVASLLPDFVAGTTADAKNAHVHVTSRPRPELPLDLTSITDHPLTRTAPKELTGFPGWEQLRDLGLAEIDHLVQDDEVGADVFGLLAAAAGPLSVADLTALRSAPAEPRLSDRRAVRALVAVRAARSLAQVGSAHLPRYQFAHATLLEHAQQHPTLADADFRQRIHAWAESWQDACWPASSDDGTGTPSYLLDTYPAALAADPTRQARVVGNVAWVDAAIRALGVDPTMTILRESAVGDNWVGDLLAVVSGQLPNLGHPLPPDQPGYVLGQIRLQALSYGMDQIATGAGDRQKDLANPGPVAEWTTVRSAPPALELGTHNGEAFAVAALPDGRVVTGGNDGHVRLWDPASPGTGAWDLGAHDVTSPVLSLATLPDGRVVSGSLYGEVLIWNPAAPGTPVSLRSYRRAVRALAVLQDGRIVAGGFMTILLLNPATPGIRPVEIEARRTSMFDVTAAAVLPDGRVVSGGSDGQVRLWNPSTTDPPVDLGTHTGGVFAVAVLPDGRVVTGGADGQVRLWSPSTTDPPVDLGTHAGAVRAAAVLPDGRVVTGGDEGQVRLWNPSTTDPPVDLGTHTGGVFAVAVLPDGRVVTGGDDWRIRLWDAGSPRTPSEVAARLPPLRAPVGHHDREDVSIGGLGLAPAVAVAFLSSGQFVTGGRDGYVRLWNPAVPGTPAVLGIHEGGVKAVAALSDGRFVTAGRDSRILMWNPLAVGTPAVLGTHEQGVHAVAVLPDGRVVTGGGRQILMWSPTSPRPIVLGTHSRYIRAVAVLPDGRVVSGSDDGGVRLWDPARPGIPINIGIHEGGVDAVGVLPDGRVVTGSSHRGVRVWNSHAVEWEIACGVASLAVAPRDAPSFGLAIGHPDGMSWWSVTHHGAVQAYAEAAPSQTPAPGSIITVPDVAGQSRAAATAALRDAGFDVEVQMPFGFEIFGVARHHPAAGAQALRGSVVTVIIV